MEDKGSNLTRRSLFRAGWWGLAVAAMARSKPLFAFAGPTNHSLEKATAESFEPLIGATFAFVKPASDGGMGSQSFAMKLEEVTRYHGIARIEAQIPAIRGRRVREPFSLVFEVRGRQPSEPGLLEFAHGEFKGCPVFLSRVQSAGNAAPIRYEAVFG
jgi:Domain of unknown function (DUF6916)